jgi:hypothetical protein
MITVNMEKAREVWRDIIRQSRDPKLAALDIEFQRCVEEGADTSAIVAQKQELRDATAYPPIDAAQTPEELKAAWPPVLDEPTPRAATRSTKN